MNRLPVAERREQLIEAALAVASREGIEAATVRAVAAEAGVSLGVVHYCFQDKDELLRAMAHAITSANLERSLGELPPEADDPWGVAAELFPGIRDEHDDEDGQGWQARWLDRPTWDVSVTPNVRKRTGQRPTRRGRGYG